MNNLVPLLDQLWVQLHINPLLQLAFAGLALVLLGFLLGGTSRGLGGFLRGIGNLALIAGLLLSLARMLHFDLGIDFPDSPGSDVEVSGNESRVTLAPDGHFWLRGTINGEPARFLVDTGATITTLSPETANRVGLEPDPSGRTITLTTANGTTEATRTEIPRLRIGSITARHLQAVVSPGMDGTNVLGMNFLSQLHSWRVEGRTLILVPADRQSAE
ncbi:MAG: TIGR02281 family clan AA aspartic protease [Sphingomonadales bacterium]|nr:TIGR02281 family clan AA aspartic protease [Sphingomonadales bacterium]